MTEYRGYTYKIEYDDAPESPREWSNLGTLVLSHRRYDFPNEAGIDFDAHNSWAEVEAELRKRGYVLVIPVFMFDHSGLSFTTEASHFRAADPHGWDWGQVGFICATRNEIKSNYMLPRNRKLEQSDIDKATEVLVGEIETFGQWSSGDVHGYIITGPDGNEVDSCWGFYGTEGVEAEAKAIIDGLWQGSQTKLFGPELVGAS